jgi:hypothetical protein
MEPKTKRGADGLVHHRPGTIEQQSEDSFQTSDAPSFSSGAIGAPEKRETKPKTGDSGAVKAARKQLKK